MSFEKAFGAELKRARKKLGYTQEQVAEAVSISVRWYQAIEKHGQLPGSLILMRLEVVLQWTPEPLRPYLGLLEPGPSRRALAKQRRKTAKEKASRSAALEPV